MIRDLTKKVLGAILRPYNLPSFFKNILSRGFQLFDPRVRVRVRVRVFRVFRPALCVRTRDVHGGAVAAGFERSHRGSGAVAVGFGKNHRGGGSIFFEDIEKLHEFGRISVFTNETP